MKRFKLLLAAGAVAVALVAGLGRDAVEYAKAQGYSLPHNTAALGHIVAQGSAPTGTGCTIAAGSTDLAGVCTTSSTSGSIAFGTAFAVAPSCIVVDQTATPVAVYTTTTTQITLTTVTSAHILSWMCMAKNPG